MEKVDSNLAVGQTFEDHGFELKVCEARNSDPDSSCRYCAYSCAALNGLNCGNTEDGRRPACCGRNDGWYTYFKVVSNPQQKLVDKILALAKVVEAQANFITILQDDLEDAAVFAAAHNWRSSLIKEGRRAHKDLEKAKKKLEEFNER